MFRKTSRVYLGGKGWGRNTFQKRKKSLRGKNGGKCQTVSSCERGKKNWTTFNEFLMVEMIQKWKSVAFLKITKRLMIRCISFVVKVTTKEMNATSIKLKLRKFDKEMEKVETGKMYVWGGVHRTRKYWYWRGGLMWWIPHFGEDDVSLFDPKRIEKSPCTKSFQKKVKKARKIKLLG